MTGRAERAEQVTAALRAAGCVFAEEEAAILIEAAGVEAVRVDAGGVEESGAAAGGVEAAAERAGGVGAAAVEAALAGLVARRVRGEPLEVIVGWADFAGVRVIVEPGVFVPRQRSALLVALTAQLAPDGATVLDLCCGSGGIGAAVAARRSDLTVLAADLDPAAVRCARRNLPVERVFEGDLFDALPAALRGTLDTVVVNAPYVPTKSIALMPPEARDHEHRIALDGGADGLQLHRRIAAQAGSWLAPAGVLVIEAGEQQAPASAEVFRGHGLLAEVVRDDEIDATAVVVRQTGDALRIPGPSTDQLVAADEIGAFRGPPISS